LVETIGGDDRSRDRAGGDLLDVLWSTIQAHPLRPALWIEPELGGDDAFIGELDLATLGFEGMLPATTGRPAYHPATLLKIYLYGYLNRIQSSRRLERETQRNIELMWLTGRLMPDFKTIADFRKDNGAAIRAACRQFVVLCRQLNLFTEAVVVIDGSKFKAVNNRDKNFTPYKVQRRMEQIGASIDRYMAAMDATDRQEGEVAQAKSARLKDKIASLKQQMQQFLEMQRAVQAASDQQISLTDPDARSMATSGKAPGSSATMCRRLSIPSITSLWPMRSRIVVTIVTSFRTWGGRHEPPPIIADRGYFKGAEILACEEIRREGGRAVWQTGFYLHCCCRRIPLPGRRTADLAIQQRRRWADLASLLDQRLRRLLDQATVHDRQRTPCQALGA
jgi:transposase